MNAGGAVLGVGFQFVGDVGRGCVSNIAAMELDCASAIRAAEFRVGVGDGIEDGLQLPERLVAATRLKSPALCLALVDFFGFNGHGGSLGWDEEKIGKL